MAQARNFLRILKQIPEASGLALLEAPANEPVAVESTLLQRVQAFTRFLLEHLHKESAAAQVLLAGKDRYASQ